MDDLVVSPDFIEFLKNGCLAGLFGLHSMIISAFRELRLWEGRA